MPSAYAALYRALSQGLDAFDREFPSETAGAARPVWGAELLVANANRGEALLRPAAMAGVRLFLDRFQALGFTATTISVNHPLLDPAFPRAAEYAAFYREVAREVRRRGLSLEVETGLLFANTPFSSVGYDYRRLSFADLTAGRRAHVAAVLREMAPDWLDLGAEPDTEARLAGQPALNDPAQRAGMFRSILGGLARGRTQVAAGIGTWNDLRVVDALLATVDLDALALHVYPLGPRQIRTAAEVARRARAAGKPLLLDEAWLYKVGPGEAVGDIAGNARIFQRDLWAFWAPLDQRFLRTIDAFARTAGVSYLSPFWSHLYFAYLDYDPALDQRDYATVNGRYLERVREAVVAGRLSPTGEMVRALLRTGASPSTRIEKSGKD